MLTIDLLRGQGIPIKSRPGGAALLAVTIAVPIVIAIIMGGNYVRSRIILSTQQQFLNKVDADISRLADSIKLEERIKRRINDINGCLAEVGDITHWHVQWSGILQALAENIPPCLVLAELSVKSGTVNKEVSSRNDPSKTINVSVPKRVLYISLYGKPEEGSDEAVLEFLRGLNASIALSDIVDTIRLLSQTSDVKKYVMHYMIECVFKS